MMADIEKIKRNIGRMIDQNAPETDIDAYLSTEGFTPDEFRTAVKGPAIPAAAPEQVAKQEAPGLLRQYTGGFEQGLGLDSGLSGEPGNVERWTAGVGRGIRDVVDTGAEGLSWLLNKAGVEDDTQTRDEAAREAFKARYGDSNLAGAGRVTGQLATSIPVTGAAGKLVQGAARGVQYVEPVVDFLSGTGGLASRAAAGSLQGAATAALPSSASDDPLRDIEIGATVGGLLPVVAAGAKKIGKTIYDAVVPQISPEAAKLAQTAADEGIDLNVAQLTNKPYYRLLDSVTRKVPLSGAQAELTAQQKAFNRAVAKRIGVDADAITSDIYQAAKERLGGEFERLSGQNVLPLTDDLIGSLGSVSDDASKFATDDTVRAVNSAIQELTSKAENGVVPGKAYQALDSKLGQLMKSGGEKSFYLGQVRDAVRGAMDNAISAEDQAAWQTARAQYRNLKAIRDIVANEGVEGNISPAKLMGRLTASGAGKEAMASGRGGDLAPLAQIGQRFLKDTVPNSGTPERLAAYSALGGGTAVAPMTTLGVVSSANLTRRYLNSDFARRAILAKALAESRGGEQLGRSVFEELYPLIVPASSLAAARSFQKTD